MTGRLRPAPATSHRARFRNPGLGAEQLVGSPPATSSRPPSGADGAELLCAGVHGPSVTALPTMDPGQARDVDTATGPRDGDLGQTGLAIADPPPGRGHHQEDLVTPGRNPACACSRMPDAGQIRTCRRYPRGRPSTLSRLRTRVALASRGCRRSSAERGGPFGVRDAGPRMISFNSARRPAYRSTSRLALLVLRDLALLGHQTSLPPGPDAGHGRLDADACRSVLIALRAQRQPHMPPFTGQPVALALDVRVEPARRTPVRVGDVVAEARLGAGQLAVGGQGVTCLSSGRMPY